MNTIPVARDKLLFTPGPLTTSMNVKQAMLRDLGSRDHEFIAAIKMVREKLLAAAGVSQAKGFEAVLMQGSGTFSLEAVVTSTIPPNGKLLVIINGAYGKRLVKIAQIHKIPVVALECPENQTPRPEDVDKMLVNDPAITNVAIVHCETTTGIMNPIEEIGRVVKKHGKQYSIDSMSAFGAVPFDLEASGADYLISSSNKCVEGVPGFAFVIFRRDTLLAAKGWARTLSLDLLDQWKGLESNGQFRFTPPTHSILAFAQALRELEAEGGAAGRAARYQANRECLRKGMAEMGFKEYLAPELQGHIITSFYYPKHPNFQFEDFYARLSARGCAIYPGKVSNADCFRIGNIGRLFEGDMQIVLGAVREVLKEMGIGCPVT
jgi:2-aminoethylphosphonate-pyruvate transaminase